MDLNIAKCEILHMTRKKNKILRDYSLKGNILNCVSSYKYLGVEINDKLTWASQTSVSAKKGFSALYFVNRCLKNSTKNAREKAYKTTVLPILEYGSAIWDPSNIRDIETIERVQRKAVRLITRNFDRSVDTKSLLNENKLIPLAIRRKVNRLVNLFKCYNDNIGFSEIKVSLKNPNYRGRHDHKFKIEPLQSRKDVSFYSFLPRTIRDWNSLPESIFVECNNFKLFRKRLLHLYGS